MRALFYVQFLSCFACVLFTRLCRQVCVSSVNAAFITFFLGTLRVYIRHLMNPRVKTQLMKHLSAPMLVEGKEVKAVQELPWYKGGLAYRLGCDRRFIRKQPHLVRAEFRSVKLLFSACKWTGYLQMRV